MKFSIRFPFVSLLLSSLLVVSGGCGGDAPPGYAAGGGNVVDVALKPDLGNMVDGSFYDAVVHKVSYSPSDDAKAWCREAADDIRPAVQSFRAQFMTLPPDQKQEHLIAMAEAENGSRPLPEYDDAKFNETCKFLVNWDKRLRPALLADCIEQLVIQSQGSGTLPAQADIVELTPQYIGNVIDQSDVHVPEPVHVGDRDAYHRHVLLASHTSTPSGSFSSLELTKTLKQWADKEIADQRKREEILLLLSKEQQILEVARLNSKPR